MTETVKTLLADIETTAITYDDGGVLIIPDKVHLITARDFERGKTFVFGPSLDSLREGVKLLEESEMVVFHNGIGFDLKVLKHHFGLKARDDWHFIDSLVLCQLFYSNIKEAEDFARFEKHKMRPDSVNKFTGDLVGKHGLEAWGLRLSPPVPKGDYAERCKLMGIDPWAEWNQDMQDYAIQDVITLEALWRERLRDRFNDPRNRNAIAVEHYMAELMETVKQSGILLDRPWAEKLCEELEKRAAILEESIQREFPPRLEPVKWQFKPIPLGVPDLSPDLYAEWLELKDSVKPEDARRVEEIVSSGPQQRLTQLMLDNPGNKIYRPYFGLPEGYLREQWGESFNPKVTRVVKNKSGEVLYTAVKDCPFTKVHLAEFNPRSRIQIVRRLLEMGWSPEEFTESGNPSVSEVELHKLEEYFPSAVSLIMYLLIQKRLGQIKTGDKAWLALADSRGFIHPTIRPCNTVTFRGTHADPNISQVPSVKMEDVTDIDAEGKTVKVYKTAPSIKYSLVKGSWSKTEGPEIKKVKQRPLKGEAGKWGWDCRACFTVPDGFEMVGSDLAGIEMRAWAHYLWKFDNGNFADVVLNKDVHEENRVILGFNDRRKAKEWLYACVPMDTLCLTRAGWKRYDQLVVGEDILTYNSETKIQEWQPLLGTVFYEDAELIRMSHGQGFSVVSTADHRWFTRRRTGGKSARYYVDEVCTTAEITSEHAIIQNAPFVGDTEGLLTASYLCWDNAVRVRSMPHAKNPMINVRQSTKNFVTGQRLTKSPAGRGDVWCPRTKNGSWVMRQGDTITITGNCMYGAGDQKLGFVIEPTASETRQKQLGAASRSRFMSGLRGYEELNDELMHGVRRGWLKGLDGRRVPVRKQHAALNSLLQSAGAIISKYWIVFALDIIENKHNLKWGYDADFTLLLYSHDELQFATRPEYVDIVKEACTAGALKSGEYLDFRLPVEVGLARGKNWGETH